MIYVCNNKNCLFLFERLGEIEACPDCGSLRVHEANEAESAEYIRNRDEMGCTGQADRKG